MFAIREGLEIGLVYLCIIPNNIWFLIFWAALILSFFTKMLFSKKCKSKITRNLGYFIIVPLLLLLDILTDYITGWERLAPLFAYFLVLAIFLGHLMYDISAFIRKRKNNKKGADSEPTPKS